MWRALGDSRTQDIASSGSLTASICEKTRRIRLGCRIPMFRHSRRRCRRTFERTFCRIFTSSNNCGRLSLYAQNCFHFSLYAMNSACFSGFITYVSTRKTVVRSPPFSFLRCFYNVVSSGIKNFMRIHSTCGETKKGKR